MATITKICTHPTSTHVHTYASKEFWNKFSKKFIPCLGRRPVYMMKNIFFYNLFFHQPDLRETFQRDPFSVQRDLSGKLLHTSWRIPTSMATDPMSWSLHAFSMANTNVYLRSLIECQVDPSSPSQLTRAGPLNAIYSWHLFTQARFASAHIWSLRRTGYVFHDPSNSRRI